MKKEKDDLKSLKVKKKDITTPLDVLRYFKYRQKTSSITLEDFQEIYAEHQIPKDSCRFGSSNEYIIEYFDFERENQKGLVCRIFSFKENKGEHLRIFSQKIIDWLDVKTKVESKVRELTPEPIIKEAEVIFKKGSPIGEFAYLEDKKITFMPKALPGGAVLLDGSLYIPLRNEAERQEDIRYTSKNEIRGYQKIGLSGYKTFPKEFVKKGSYCLLLPDGSSVLDFSTILVCEGYATGCSLLLAAQLPVLCAMDAGNIAHALESFLLETTKEYNLLFCADDDRFTTLVREGKEVKFNAGVSYSNNAARRYGGKVVTPRFHKETKGTDFNDLHVLEGLDEVRVQVEEALHEGERGSVTCSITYESIDFGVAEVKDDEKQSFKLGELQLVDEVVSKVQTVVQIVTDGRVPLLAVWNGYHWELKEDSSRVITSLENKINKYLRGRYSIAKLNIFTSKVLSHLPRVPNSAFSTIKRYTAFRDGTVYVEREGSRYYLRHELDIYHREDYLFGMVDGYFSQNKRSTLPVKFLDWLREALDQDEDKIRSIRQMFGAAIMPVFPKIFVLYGPGGTGKSTLIEVLMGMLGTVNYGSADLYKLGDRFGLTQIAGKSLNIVTEISKTKVVPAEDLKKIIDMVPFDMEYKFKSSFKSCIPAVHILAGNNKPLVENESQATLARRFIMIEMNKSFLRSDNSADTYKYSDILLQEKEQILSWALGGLEEIVEAGGEYFRPESSKKSVGEFAKEHNSFVLFYEDLCDGAVERMTVTGEDKDYIRVSSFKEAYLLWASSNDRFASNAFTKHKLVKDMKLFPKLRKTTLNGIDVIRGIKEIGEGW